MTGRPRVPWTMERLESRVERVTESGCWLWTWRIGTRGYGRTSIDGKHIEAHRLAAMLAGNDVRGKHVCHRCDVRSCVNPAHLFIGTHADNMRDCASKGRRPPSHLRASDIDFIRNGPLGRRQLARKFSLSPSYIGRIRSGKVNPRVTNGRS